MDPVAMIIINQLMSISWYNKVGSLGCTYYVAIGIVNEYLNCIYLPPTVYFNLTNPFKVQDSANDIAKYVCDNAVHDHILHTSYHNHYII